MSLLPALLWFLAALVLLFNMSRLSAPFSEYPIAVKLAELAVLVIGLAFFYKAAKDVLIFLTTELGFTDRRLIGKVGILRMRTLLTPLDKINHISATNGVLGRFLGFGNVLVHTSSGQITYEQIVNHTDFITSLMEQIAAWHQDAAVGHPVARPETGVARPDPGVARREPAAANPASGQGRDAWTPLASAPVPSAPGPAAAPPDPEKDLRVPPVQPGPSLAGKPKDPAGKPKEPAGKGMVGHCPNCQAPYSYSPSHVGRTTTCRKCGTTLTIATKSATA